MRLLLITNDYPPSHGGIQQYLGDLVDAHEGDVLVLAPAAGPAVGTGRGEAVVRRHRRRFLWPTPGVRRWLHTEAAGFDPDVIVFGAPYPLAWMGARMGRDLNVPTAAICHGAEVTIPRVLPIARQLVRRSLRGVDLRLAVSRFTARRVERLTGMPVSYLGSGVDISVFTPEGNEGRSENVPVVGCVSRFVPRKGQHRLIRAAAELSARGTPIRLLFVGSGRKLSSLRRRAERSGVDVRFEVDVPWSSLPGLYRQMDVFCMPCRSRWAGLEVEGLGIVYLEAAASGLPVLAGNSGGASETVVPGRTGFVVQRISDIVEGIDLLIGDPLRAAEMGAEGRQFVTTEYAWRVTAQRLALAVSGIEQA